MTLTPDQQIAIDRANLQAALIDPSIVDKRYIYEQIDRLNGSQITTTQNGGGGSGSIGTIKTASVNPTISDSAQAIVMRPSVVNQVGSVNPSADTPLATGARIRGLLFTNLSSNPIFLGVYSSASALTSASVPSNGHVIRVPSIATLDKGVGDFGETGRLFASNTRIGLSTTMGTYTALSPADLALCSINIETIDPTN